MQWRTQQGQGFQILLDFCVTADVGQDPSDRAEKEGGERQGFPVLWLALGKGLVSAACLKKEQLWSPWLVSPENDADIRLQKWVLRWL